MDQTGTNAQAGRKPAAPGMPVRPGGSGEGARSALEELIQQERKRVEQRPRESGDGSRPPEHAP